MTRRARNLGLGAPLLVVALLLAGPVAARAAVTFRPCPGDHGLGCTKLKVRLDYSGKTPGTIALNVRRLLAGSTPSSVAVIGLAGGPGQAAAPLTREFQQMIRPALSTRDLIVFDQRGTGESDPLSCAAVDASMGSQQEVAHRCALEIGAKRAFFTTSDSVDDIESIRQALGYQKLVLFGVSYGTKVALEYAERYPQYVSGLVLDSVVLVSGPDPLERSTFAAIPGVIRRLCANRACAGISSDPVGELAALVRKMTRKPLHGHVFDGSGRRVEMSMSPDDLLNLLIGGDLDPVLRAELPASVDAALHDDPDPLLRLSLLAEGLVPDSLDGAALTRDARRASTLDAARLPGGAGALLGGLATRTASATATARAAATAATTATATATAVTTATAATTDSGNSPEAESFDNALYLDTSCEEEPFPWQPRTAKPVSRLLQAVRAVDQLSSAQVYPFNRTTALTGENISNCLEWPVRSPAPPGPTPLPNVPALIVSGGADLRTPTSDARKIVAAIPDAQLLVVPNVGHSTIASDPTSCTRNALRAFFAIQQVGACEPSKNPYPPSPLPPVNLSHVAPEPGVAGRAGRTLAAVQDTLVDLRLELIGAVLNAEAVLPPGSRVGGLRGGSAEIERDHDVVLRAISYVPGVTLSGTLPSRLLANRSGPGATIVVAGSRAARGSVQLTAGNHATGKLGSMHFDVVLAKEASTAAQADPFRLAPEPGLAHTP